MILLEIETIDVANQYAGYVETFLAYWQTANMLHYLCRKWKKGKFLLMYLKKIFD